MSIKPRENIYNGVNAHLNSQLQHEFGAWEVLHSGHITDITRAIDAALPPGYLAENERGLQIRTIHIDDEDSILAGLEYGEDVYLTAVAIREVLETGEIGKPVTWIELLSATNKPPGQGFFQYREKRITALKSGIALVEIDYLHETRSPISNSLSYPDKEEGATPYIITVTNPRPNLETGRMKEFGFQVDDPLPTVKIPLKDEDSVTVNFQEIYNRTYESLHAFSYRVDYDIVPVGMDTYVASDQKRILAVMERARRIAANSQTD